MAQSKVTVEHGKVFQGTVTNGGGTFTADYAIPIDQAAHLKADCLLTRATASHLAGTACVNCDYVVENKNGTLATPAAIASGNNPANNTTTTYVAASAQANDDVASGTIIAAWSISTTNARVTVTNNTAATYNVSVVVTGILVGST